MIAKLITGILACACLFLALELERMRPYWPLSRTITPPSTRPGAASANTDDEEMLGVVISEMTMDNLPLENAFAKLTDKTSVNIVGDWQMLKYLKVHRTTPVTLHLRNETLRQALNEITAYLETDMGKTGFFITDGVVTITSQSAAEKASNNRRKRQITTEFIDVRPLVRELQKASLPQYPHEDFPVFSEDSSKIRLPAPALHMDYGSIIRHITDSIVRAVDQESWQSNGGEFGSIGEIAGVLAVTATPDDIRQIRSFLDALNKAAVAGNSPTSKATLGYVVDFGSGVAAADTAPVTRTVTECFNMRALVDQLETGKEPPTPEPLDRLHGLVLDVISSVTCEIVAPDSWEDHGGKPGTMHQLVWANVVTQTPENMAKVRNVHDCLARASIAKHFPPPSVRARTNFVNDARIICANDSNNGTITEFINVRSLIERIQLLAPLSRQTKWPADMLAEICRIITDNVDPQTWKDAGGTIGSMRAADDVLVITHTAKGLEKVRNVLDSLDRATSATHFAPDGAPQPAEMPEILPSDIASSSKDACVIAYFNVVPLIRLWSGQLSKRGDSVHPFIRDVVMATVDPKAWQDYENIIFDLGGVMVVSSTPQRVKAVQNELELEYRKMLHGDFPQVPRAPDADAD